MGTMDDPFLALATGTLAEAEPADDFAALQARAVGAATDAGPAMGAVAGTSAAGATGTTAATATVARLHGFDLLDQPVIGDLPQCPGQLIAARSTVALKRSMVGADVVVIFDGGDLHRPIVMGVITSPRLAAVASPVAPTGTTIHADDERYVVTAEREIVLRCGDASITLTRAGKVIIKGHYILSRSSGYNKIKGAAIDIN